MAPPQSPFPPLSRWETALPSSAFGPIASDGPRIFVPLTNGEIAAYDATTGFALWTRPASGSANWFVAANDRVVFAVSEDGVALGIDASTGDAVWKRETGFRSVRTLALDANRAVIGGDDGLVSLDAVRGDIRFSIATPPVSALDLAGERLASIESGRLVVRARADGAVLFSLGSPESTWGRPRLLQDGSVVLGSGQRSVREVSQSGKLKWRFRVGAAVTDRPIEGATREDGVFFASREGVFYVSTRGGSLKNRAVLPSRPYSDPLALGRAILVPCREDEVVAIDPRAGRRLGTTRFPGTFTQPPVLATGGRIAAVVSSPARLIGVEVRLQP